MSKIAKMMFGLVLVVVFSLIAFSQQQKSEQAKQIKPMTAEQIANSVTGLKSMTAEQMANTVRGMNPEIRQTFCEKFACAPGCGRSFCSCFGGAPWCNSSAKALAQ